MTSTPMWTRKGPYVLEWDDCGRLLNGIAQEIREAEFRPDVVCAVARGGLLAASYLAMVLDTARLTAVRVRRTTSDEQYATKSAPVIDTAAAADLRPGDRVLVVDDIVGTGATAHAISAFLDSCSIGAARFVALTRNRFASFPLAHCGVVVDDWVIFPWESGWADRPTGWRSIPSDDAEVPS